MNTWKKMLAVEPAPLDVLKDAFGMTKITADVRTLNVQIA